MGCLILIIAIAIIFGVGAAAKLTLLYFGFIFAILLISAIVLGVVAKKLL